MQQHTLNERIELTGIGLHTGENVTVELLPASENTGYRIRRTDLEGTPEFPALADAVVSTQRATLLKKGEVTVSTVEHAISALYALGVDNCIIAVNGPELPILDGSAKPYVEAIQQVGIKEQSAERDYFVIKHPYEVIDAETGSRILMVPSDDFRVEAHVEFDAPSLNNQVASYRDGDDYAKEIAGARSFVFVREILPLLEKNLIKGGDLSNALIINDQPLSSQEAESFKKNFPQYSEQQPLGYINPSAELGDSEPARHKILDIIGDLALAGKYIKGHIIAFRPGHSINNKAACELRKAIKQNETQAPYYDPNQTPLMDVNRIRELLPHRYPFLLVDKIIDLQKQSVVGVKNVTGNEPFFTGHFPEEPVMPGVLIVEAMAQTGGVLVLNSVAKEGEDWSTYFMKIDNVKFRQKVVPGDTLVFKLKLLTEIRRGIANMRGLAFVGEKLVCEAEFTAQIVKNEN